MPSRKATMVALVGTLALGTLAATALTGLAPTAAAAGTTYTATADTYVDSQNAATNYGAAQQLGVDNSPVKQLLLRFDVSGLAQPVTSAKLRIHVDDVSGAEATNGGTFRAMSNTTWSETSVTYDNRPAIDGATLGTLGAVARNTWYEVDVTSYVKGNGTFAIGVTSSSSNGADYDSRETGATAPQLVIETGSTPTPTPTTPTPTSTTAPPTGDPVLVGAGDIATSGSGDTATANLLDTISGTVFTLGDNAYPNGTASDFSTYYEPTWGRHKARTKPAPGNHDYNTSGASAYYSYFGAGAGPSGQGYYSYDLGNWHVVSLNSETSMAVGSAQEKWLRADLAASTKQCTVAYWHKPRWTSSSSHAPDPATGPLVQALYDYNAEVVLTGHNHQYERFAPQNPSGQLDTARGLRQFVAGMGGADLYGFGTIQANSEARNNDTFGVLKLTLHANSYDWQFVPQAGKTYNDSGTGTCH
ncbi:CBM96 family carbohydrate-binding protein [Streptomyces showdoensis]|uniref:Alkaline phosphatase n=1 Tax=Streptomyces showdoensis TaxID=68268 RepID=A0A2P2GLF4_STREW|nr:DNRLRE domain-containing protein [Streptomyces showdoensis]KKZ71635.1 alkaline phosphatase [Streptomyces showdoensis]